MAQAPFDSLEPDKLRRTAIAMGLREVKAGEVVVQEGEKGDECYLVESGTLTVSVGGKEVRPCAAPRDSAARFGALLWRSSAAHCLSQHLLTVHSPACSTNAPIADSDLQFKRTLADTSDTRLE